MRHIDCSKCNRAISFADSISGQGVCPHCGQIIPLSSLPETIPEPSPREMPERFAREAFTWEAPEPAPPKESPQYLDDGPGLPPLRPVRLSIWRLCLPLAVPALLILVGTGLLAWWLGGGTGWEMVCNLTLIVLVLITASIFSGAIKAEKGE